MKILDEPKVVHESPFWQTVALPDGTKLVRRTNMEDEDEEDNIPRPRRWRSHIATVFAYDILKLYQMDDAIIYASPSSSQFNHHTIASYTRESYSGAPVNNWVVKIGMDATLYGQREDGSWKIKPKTAREMWPWFHKSYPNVQEVIYLIYSVVANALAPMVKFAAVQRVRNSNQREALRIMDAAIEQGKSVPTQVKYWATQGVYTPEDFNQGLWLNMKEKQVRMTQEAVIKGHVDLLLRMDHKLQSNGEADGGMWYKGVGQCSGCGRDYSRIGINQQTVLYRFPDRCWEDDCEGTPVLQSMEYAPMKLTMGGR